MRMPAGLKKLDDRVLGSRGQADGARAGTGRSDSHEDVYPQDKERSVEKTEQHTEPEDRTDDEASAPPAAERTKRTERTQRTRRGARGDDAEAKAGTRGNGDGVQKVLATVWRISRLVLLALGLLLIIAIALILAPANEDNVIVRNVLSYAETVAGPFKDVFTVDDPERMRIYNYGLAAAVYVLAASVVGKLPTGGKRKTG